MLKENKSELLDTWTDESTSKNSLTYFIKNKNMIELLQKKGIKQLFPIQEKTYEAINLGLDLIGRDRTGSGKTLAYALPII